MKSREEENDVRDAINGTPCSISDKVDASPESGVLYARLSTKPPTIKHSSGIYLNTDDGRQILDASCGAAVACLGHNNPRVKDAIVRQLDDVAYCYAPFFTTAPAEELAKRLCASTGWQMSRVFIVSSGK
jgi:adenosylmethionine-8-amino-7-oxononanoate aminotransferase